MLNFLLFTVCAVCVILLPRLGGAPDLTAVFPDGAAHALQFVWELAPVLCLWSAVLELGEACGLDRLLRRLLGPLLSRLFPRAYGDRETAAALCENVSANLLGLGNAATPAGIRAAKGMARLSGGRASDELCTLVVLNTASLQLFPATVAALRASAGAARPLDILPAVLLSSLCSVAAGLLAAALLRRIWPWAG